LLPWNVAMQLTTPSLNNDSPPEETHRVNVVLGRLQVMPSHSSGSESRRCNQGGNARVREVMDKETLS
jgi:hypothetical protein